jgi:hypothetical protein
MPKGSGEHLVFDSHREANIWLDDVCFRGKIGGPCRDPNTDILSSNDEKSSLYFGLTSPDPARSPSFNFGVGNQRVGAAGGFQRWMWINNGNVAIAGTLTIGGGADLSENFDIHGAGPEAARSSVEPGTVVCIDPENPGKLNICRRAYDRTVAGIVSGAGQVKTGMRMGQESSIANGDTPVALTGRVYVRADATGAPIRPGDLLTTSDVPGFAQRVQKHDRAIGAILGKAMTGLDGGQDLVLVLVSLQ